MTTTEKLNAIADKCRDLLARDYGPRRGAGWLTTLAAIESVQTVNRGTMPSLTQREYRLVAEIFAAWEGLL